MMVKWPTIGPVRMYQSYSEEKLIEAGIEVIDRRTIEHAKTMRELFEMLPTHKTGRLSLRNRSFDLNP